MKDNFNLDLNYDVSDEINNFINVSQIVQSNLAGTLTLTYNTPPITTGMVGNLPAQVPNQEQFNDIAVANLKQQIQWLSYLKKGFKKGKNDVVVSTTMNQVVTNYVNPYYTYYNVNFLNINSTGGLYIYDECNRYIYILTMYNNTPYVLNGRITIEPGNKNVIEQVNKDIDQYGKLSVMQLNSVFPTSDGNYTLSIMIKTKNVAFYINGSLVFSRELCYCDAEKYLTGFGIFNIIVHEDFSVECNTGIFQPLLPTVAWYTYTMTLNMTGFSITNNC